MVAGVWGSLFRFLFYAEVVAAVNRCYARSRLTEATKRSPRDMGSVRS